MNSFHQLDRLFNADLSPDYWYDEGVESAEALIAGFEPAEWDALAAAWRERTEPWQRRCAYSLHGAPPERAAPILVALLFAESEAAAVDALESLGTLEASKAAAALDAAALERLRAVANSRAGRARAGLHRVVSALEAAARP